MTAQGLGDFWKFWKGLSLVLMIGQSWVGANAASEKTPVQKWTNDQNAAVIPKRTQHKNGEDRKEMQKETTMIRCTSLKGSSWSAEKKYMRRYTGTFDIFFGVEQRMRKEEMEEQFDKEAKQGWIFAAHR